MKRITNKLSSHKKLLSTKLVMGVMVAAVSVLVGTAGVVGAMPGGSHGGGHSVGYGGDIGIDLSIIGDNNLVSIIINYFS